uniref:Uncharacterized protein n=1 Tax=Staphylococcus aureus TaxID=1280 RepID=Q93IC8_STAAU|nr:hypothetical protein [Staphylococcus aureus]
MKSPLNNPIGILEPPPSSVSKKLILSGGWPGVCKTSNLIFPK